MRHLKEQVKAIIFDLDGTLVTSTLDFSRMRSDISCPPDEDVLVYINSLDEASRQAANAVIHRHEMDDAQSVDLIPGAESLLDQLHTQGLKTAIVTRNSKAATGQKLSRTGLRVESVLTRECAPAKPHPGALLQLCDTWQIAPEQAVYVGDYLYDLQAAANARMHSCLFVSDELPDYADQAGFICQDYAKFITILSDYLATLPKLKP